MKIVLLLVICLCFVYIAVQVKNYYIKRCAFYASFVTFINTLSSEISFLKSDYATIINSNSFGKDVDTCLKCYLGNLPISINYLTSDEIDCIVKFLDSIGKTNVQGELNNIQFYLNQFNQKVAKCNQEKLSHGMLWFKLICLFGLLVCIVLI